MIRVSLRRSGFALAGLSKGLVGRGRRPADDHQEHLQHEQGDGDVVIEGGVGRVRPKLISGPEEKRNREKDSLGQVANRGAMRAR